MEQLCPVGERLVGCYDRTGLFIAVGNKPEEQVAFFAIDGRLIKPKILFGFVD